MAQKNRIQIQNQINNDIVSNNSRLITAPIVNAILNDINDSSVNTLSDNTSLGLYQFSVSRNYSLNECVVYNNNIYKANTSISAGTFSNNQWDIIGKQELVIQLDGTSNNAPTISTKYNTIPNVTPSCIRTSIGQFQLSLNTNVFSSTYSFTLDGFYNKTNLPIFPISTGQSSNTFTFVVYDINYSLTDVYQGYITITKY